MKTLHWRMAAAGCALLACACGRAAEPAPAALQLSIAMPSTTLSGSAAPGLRHYAASASAELAPRWRSFATVAGQRSGDTSGMPGSTDLQARVQTGLAWDGDNGGTLSVAVQRGLTRAEPARALVLGWTMKY
ncbi:hypothetical protein [Aquabacterium sp.]|uniref:hypothetical protein n=1 Tax=Aquabacterium sp. TaxID=1872578 RepID=UPI002BE97EED|nr:hypothetical protein [Aquabacterium sp.]HSW08272.1 hypothetical protein [Aquabacterium sp.]